MISYIKYSYKLIIKLFMVILYKYKINIKKYEIKLEISNSYKQASLLIVLLKFLI